MLLVGVRTAAFFFVPRTLGADEDEDVVRPRVCCQ